MDWGAGEQCEVFEPKPNGGGESSAGRTRLGLIPFDQIRPGTEPPYLIKGLVPREGLTVLWGEPKSGKSFQAFDMAMAVVRGLDYRGRRAQQGVIVYIAAEGATGFRNRVEAYRRHHGIEGDLPFYLLPDSVKLQADAPALIESIRATLGDIKLLGVVLDTLNRSMEGDENSPEDMGAYIKAADAIREAFSCAVIIVHHCGTEGRRPRGHTSLTGAADAQLAVKRNGDNVITTTVEWMKDGPEGDVIYSSLNVVTVGHDDDGDEITSCVMVEAEAPSTSDKPSRRKLRPNTETMLGILEEHRRDGLEQAEWYRLGREEGVGLRRKQDLGDCRRDLLAKGLIRECQSKWYPA